MSMIQSNYSGFGSGHVPGELGFALQNRGCLFALDAKHPNRLEPKKRPFHTIIPAFVTKDGKPWFSFGVMGGDIQPQGHVQILCNMIDWGMDVQSAGDAPRFVHSGSSDPTGSKAKDGGVVRLESEIGPEVRRALKSMGHRVAADRPLGVLRRLSRDSNRRRSSRPYGRFRIQAGRGGDGLLIIGDHHSRCKIQDARFKSQPCILNLDISLV